MKQFYDEWSFTTIAKYADFVWWSVISPTLTFDTIKQYIEHDNGETRWHCQDFKSADSNDDDATQFSCTVSKPSNSCKTSQISISKAVRSNAPLHQNNDYVDQVHHQWESSEIRTLSMTVLNYGTHNDSATIYISHCFHCIPSCKKRLSRTIHYTVQDQSGAVHPKAASSLIWYAYLTIPNSNIMAVSLHIHSRTTAMTNRTVLALIPDQRPKVLEATTIRSTPSDTSLNHPALPFRVAPPTGSDVPPPLLLLTSPHLIARKRFN